MANHRTVRLFWPLLKRQITERYLSSLAGGLWVFVQPLALLYIYSFVFVEVLRARLPESVPAGFVPFLAVAFWPWTAFSESLIRSATAMQDNHDLIGKVALPRQVLVASRVAASFLVHVVGYVFILAVLEVTSADFHWAWLPAALGVVALLGVLAYGLGLTLSALQVFVPDTALALNPLLTLWFFATPILYAAEMVPARFDALLAWNPMTTFVDALRDMLLAGAWTPSPRFLLTAIGVLGVAALGRWFFLRCSPRFEDFL